MLKIKRLFTADQWAFVVTLLSFVFIGLSDRVDDIFDNAISINAVVVSGSFALVDTISQAIGRLGVYSYRVKRSQEGAHLTLNFISSLVVGLIVYALRVPIAHIFALAPDQSQLLMSLLGLYVIYSTAHAMSDAVLEFAQLRGQIKQYNRAVAIFCATLIAADSIIFFTLHDLTALYYSIIGAWLVSSLAGMAMTRLAPRLPSFALMRYALRYGMPLGFSGLFTKLANICSGALISRLGTTEYAIFTVCFSVSQGVEIVNNAFMVTLFSKINQFKSAIGQARHCRLTARRRFWLTLLFTASFSTVYLLLVHGSVPLEATWPVVVFFVIASLVEYFYRVQLTLCVSQARTKVTIFSAIGGGLVRVAVFAWAITQPYALYWVAAGIALDYATRYLICHRGVRDIWQRLRLRQG